MEVIKIKRQSSQDYQSEDKFFKGLGLIFPDTMPKLVESNLKPKSICTEEQLMLRERIQRPDLVYDCEDNKSLLIEFQSTKPTTKRLDEMMCYLSYHKLYHNSLVQPRIICTDIEKTYTEKVYLTPDSYINFRLISLKKHNGDKILLNITDKINNNKELTELEQVFLALIPFTKLSIPIEDAIYEGAYLTNEAILTNKRCQELKALQSTISVKLVPEDKQDAIRRVIKMNNNLFKEEFKQAEKMGEQRGEQRGRKTERLEMVEKMRLNGIDENTIQKIIK